MPNIGGPTTERRKALHSVVQSIVLYAAHVWITAVLTKAYRKQLPRADRKSLLRVACAYRTVSAEAFGVINGCIRMHVLVKARERIYERRNEDIATERLKKEERERSIMVWQDEMRRVAQWTKSLIPNLRRRMDCVHRRLDYFLTQMLIGHGCFRAYLYRFGNAL
ncbi:uncharacterized protein [Diabrotica undecimpunctata]|uniref:uncharacterized protein n=1 Tax=Diabrotica undecimpunctata TaxID=50387 RepID=UPI003B641861